VLLCSVSLFIVSGDFTNALAQQMAPIGERSQDVKQALSIAETEHEIIRLLIKQGQFERVLPEMNKIFQLDLPIKYEVYVAQSASLIAEMLVEKNQFLIAHQVLNQAIKNMKKLENQAALYKIQAFVFKSEGNNESALECLQRAIELEKQASKP
jgi:tetratricopeptide (TPR) repeat protein